MLPTFDIEAVNWVNPIAVGFFDGQNYHEFIKESERDDVIWRFLEELRKNFKGIKIYGHCASKYDNKFILASLCKHGEIAGLEAGLIRLRWKGPNITFEDSYLLLPMALKKVNEMFEVEEKGEWDHEKGLKPWEMGEALTTFRGYLKNDCISLSHSLYALCEMLGRNFGITPSISLSTTAAKAFDKCFYELERVDSNEEFEELIRKAIYGGRNEVYKRYGEDINLYDVRSMYVSCYDTPMPIGRMRWVRPNIDKGVVAEVSIKIPKDKYIGPLPYRIGGRLTFPVGEFQGVWDMREIRNAIKEGADVVIRRQLNCDEEPILKDFGLFVSSLRKGKKSFYWKMFGLSLSGKLGQSRWRDEIKHYSSLGSLEGFHPIDKDETFFQGKIYMEGRAPYVKPAVAMRVRSEARTRHLRVLSEALKKGEIFYGDTDSVFTTSELTTGKEIGELTSIGKAKRGYFIRQKLYGVVKGNTLVQKSAGFSDLKLSESDFQELLGGKELWREYKEISSYTKILRDNELEWLNKKRVIKTSDTDSRVSLGIDTRPVCLPDDKEKIRLLRGY